MSVCPSPARIDHRVLLEAIERGDIGALVQQLSGHRCLAVECRRHQRRDAVDGRLVHVGAGSKHLLGEVQLAVLEQDDERAFTQTISGVHRGALRECPLDGSRIAIARGGEEAGVERQVVVRRGLRMDGQRNDAGHEKQGEKSQQHENPLEKC